MPQSDLSYQEKEAIRPNRIAQLDTMRGIAVLLVFVFHGLMAYSGGYDPTHGLSEIVDLGRMGVVVFFLISGFVIVRAIRAPSLNAVKIFWINRFFRLFPAYWLTIGIAVLLSIAGVPKISILASSLNATDVLANITMMPRMFGATLAVGVFWTLQVEMIFYALISVAVLLFPVNRYFYSAFSFFLFSLSIIYALGAIVTHRADHLSTDQIYLGFFHLSIMFCGAGLRLHWEAREGQQSGFISTIPMELKIYFLMVVVFLLIYTVAKIHNNFDIHSFRAVGTYGFSFLIFLLGIEYLQFSRVWKFLGDRSYSFYLLHMPVLAAFYAFTLSPEKKPMLPFVVFLVLTFACSLAVSSLMYWFVEKPSNKIGHRYAKSKPIYTLSACRTN